MHDAGLRSRSSAGTAAGISETSSELGAALGIAVLGTVAHTVFFVVVMRLFDRRRNAGALARRPYGPSNCQR